MASLVTNCLLLFVAIISIASINTVAIFIHDGNSGIPSQELVSSVNRQIRSKTRGIHLVISPSSNGYEIFMVYPWYKSVYAKNTRDQIVRMLK